MHRKDDTMNKYATALRATRGFAGTRINADIMSAEDVKVWHEALNGLHNVAYDVASTRYNEAGSDAGILVSKFYEALRKVYGLIGELDNGARLRADANCINTIVTMSTCQKAKKSAQLDYVMGQKRTDAQYLRTLENTNGADPKTIEKLRANIAEYDKQIEELKAESMNYYKQMGKTSASAFYKAIEDFLADQVEGRAIMTEEEVQAEKKAKNAKVAEKRKAAKANK